MARPNILFFLSDQHNADFLGHRGHEVVQTPALDALAAQGTSFTQAYCQNPLCVPSRASLLTGKYSRNIGIYDNQDILEAYSDTFPRRLASAGYRTCLVGKAHFNGEQYHGYHQRPYGDLYGQGHQPDPARLPSRGDSGLMHWMKTAGPSGIPVSMTQTEICVAESVKWLQSHVSLHEDQPFMLSVHFDKPHFPVNPPQAFFERYRDQVEAVDAELNDGALVPFAREAIRRFYQNGEYNTAIATQLMAAYCGCIEWIDDAIGRVLDALEYLGLAENTLVVYASDHGEMAGTHGTWQKTLFYDASTKVPLIIRWPGKLRAPTTVDAIVGLLDLYPTLCETAGVEANPECDGLSLLALSRGEELSREMLYCESVVLGAPEHAGCMLRTGDWKYNLYLDGNQELYYLRDDPGEMIDLATEPEQADRVAAFAATVTGFWEPKEQMVRYSNTPRMRREKHFYPWSNQFVLGGGQVADARP